MSKKKKFDRSAINKGTSGRSKQSNADKDKKSGFKDIFNEKIGKAKWWAAKADDYGVDILPYQAGANDPLAEEGDWTYILSVQVHSNVGPQKDSVVCLAQYGKPCPVCEMHDELQDAHNEEYEFGDPVGKDIWKKKVFPYKAKDRVVYNVVVRKNGEEKCPKGVRVWEISHHFAEKKIQMAATNKKTGDVLDFTNVDEGKTVYFTRTGVGSTNTGYEGYSFEDRDDDITDKDLESAYCLDELLDMKTYDEIQVIMGNASASESNEGKKDLDCPEGEVFGYDYDSMPECDDCDIRKKCKKMYRKVNK